MGDFIIQIDDGPKMRVPNTFHIESALPMWEVVFEGSTAPTFKIGITGLNVPDDPTQRPDSTPLAALTDLDLDTDRDYSDLQADKAHDDGGMSTEHRTLMVDTSPKSVTFTVTEKTGGADIVTVSAAHFSNDADWSPSADPDTGEEYWLDCDTWFADGEGYPWNYPKIFSGALGVGMEEFEENLWRACSMPIGGVYLVTNEVSPKLIASAVFKKPLLLHPGETLSIAYEARVDNSTQPVGGLTAAFLTAIAKAMFGGTPLDLEDVEVGLASNAPSSIPAESVLGDMEEITGDGYARAAATGFDAASGTPGADAILQLSSPPFSNTGSTAWPEFQCVFVVGTLDGTEQLLWTMPPGAPLSLPAGDTYTPTIVLAWGGRTDG